MDKITEPIVTELGLKNPEPLPYESLNMVASRHSEIPLAVVLVILLVVVLVSLIVVPWQQSVVAMGEVTVFSPMNRPQTVNAPIEGRLIRWHAKEGDIVEAGALLVELGEINPRFLAQDQLKQLERQQEALVRKRQATRQLVHALRNQVQSRQALRGNAVPAADVQVIQANDRLIASQQKLAAAQQQLKTAEVNYYRRQELYEKGLRSRRDFELSEMAHVQAQADVRSAQAELDIARNQTRVNRFKQGEISAETLARLQESEAKLAESLDKLAGIDSDILKIEIDISNLKNRIAQRKIMSPVAGQVVRTLKLGSGEMVKAGEPMATIVPVPDQQDQAVALYVPDWNVPLISEGRHVRIQFAGWPSIQFSGWPSIAVGTFGGTVKVIDPVGDARNRYRVLVVPDQSRIAQGDDEPWPSPKNLRPGAQANGWIMLDTVPLGFELWRQMNGFPPSVDREILKPKATAGKKK